MTSSTRSEILKIVISFILSCLSTSMVDSASFLFLFRTWIRQFFRSLSQSVRREDEKESIHTRCIRTVLNLTNVVIFALSYRKFSIAQGRRGWQQQKQKTLRKILAIRDTPMRVSRRSSSSFSSSKIFSPSIFPQKFAVLRHVLPHDAMLINRYSRI